MNESKEDLDAPRTRSWVGRGSRDREPAATPRVVLAVIALVIVVSGFYFARRAGDDPQVYSNDFNVFYHASREVLAGYDPYQTRLGDWTPYLYPPLLALLLTPLAVLPLPVAAYVWFLINAASTVAATWMSARLARSGVSLSASTELTNETPGTQSRRVFPVPLVAAVSLLVVARFVLDNFNLGQVNPVVAALAAAHVYLHLKDKKTASALALAIAASIKLTPLVLIGYHVARRRWNFAAACLGMFVVVTALSFLPFGSRAPAAFHEFVNRTIKNEQGFDLAYAGNQSLRGVVARMTPASPGASEDTGESSRRPSDNVTLLISLALLAVAMIAANRVDSELIAAAPFVCCFVLLSPLSWKAHFVVLILPVVALVAEAARARTARRKILVATLVAVFVLFNLTSLRVFGARATEWSDAHSLAFVGALLTFGALVWVSWFAPKK